MPGRAGTRWHHGCVQGTVVTVTDEVGAPVEPAPDALRDGYFSGTSAALFGIARFDGHLLRSGPVTLFQFGSPRSREGGWAFPIEGGLLARRPAGELRVGWREGRLYCSLEGYEPRLPGPIFRLTQLRFHREVSRIALFGIRGRIPSAGIPAEPWRRLVAGMLDAGFAVAVGAARMPLRAGTRAALAGAAYLATQTVIPALTGGITPGGWVVGTRISALDGSRVHLAQLLLRLLALPLGARTLRDRHDELAGTEVLLDRAGPAG